MEEKLVKLLYDEDILSAEEYERVLQEHEVSGESCDVVLDRLNILHEDDIIAFLAKKSHLGVIDWSSFTPDAELFTVLPEESARKYMVFPFLKEQGKRQAKLTLAVADPFDIQAINDITFMTGCTIKTALASSRAIHDAIQRYYAGISEEPELAAGPTAAEGSAAPEEMRSSTGIPAVDSLLSSLLRDVKSEDEDSAEFLAGSERDHPSIKLLLDLLKLCAEHGYPELHIEARDSDYSIRIAQHGRLREHTTISTAIGREIAARLQRALQLSPHSSIPQSGSFSMTLVGEKTTQVQASFYPGIAGEKIQLNLQDSSVFETLEQSGVDEATQKSIGRLIARPQGLLLLVSPPRQGKSASMHALLHKLCQTEGQKVLALEASNGRVLPHITHVPFSAAYSYQDWCSFIAYQAPQILALDHPSEIGLRGRLACEFAPGALVLMTIAAQDTASGICRFLDSQQQISEAGYSLMLDTLNGVLSQRLLQTLCPHCKKEASLSQKDLTLLKRLFSSEEGGLGNFTNYTAQGCEECQGTGYAGQVSVFELIRFDKGLKQELFSHRADCAHYLRRYCAETLRGGIHEQALNLLRDGRCSLAEIRRALYR